MNVEDALRKMTRWHWLAVVAIAAGAASWYLPAVGWSHLLGEKRVRIDARLANARKRLAGMKAMEAAKLDKAEKEVEALEARARAVDERIAECGFGELPPKGEAAFLAQSAVAGALGRRRIRTAACEADANSAKIAYKATGDFRDIFLCLVDQTRVKGHWTFRDISVRAGGGGAMDASWELEVNSR